MKRRCILKRAPWWGVFFARLIRCVKHCFKKKSQECKTVVRRSVDRCYRSGMCVEFTCDLREPFTRSHLITRRRLLSIPDDIIVAEEGTSKVSLLTRKRPYLLLLLFLETLEKRIRGGIARTSQS